MIPYADFYQSRTQRMSAMEKGLHEHFGIPKQIKVFLDNGAFAFIKKGGEVPVKEYKEFIQAAQPDWYPIPQDFIPTPKMTLEEQEECFKKTMNMNFRYYRGDYVPVIHISNFLEQYIEKVINSKGLSQKKHIALGGIVPNLLRAPKAIPHQKIIHNLLHFRASFRDKKIHVFGLGGNATLHIAALLGINSADSSGWRNRAARGLIQLPGTGDRVISRLGNWKGREISKEEEKRLEQCQCPACQQYGIDGLKADKRFGFYNRASHNLWVLHEEARLIEEHINILGDYETWYSQHLDNTMYLPLIKQVLSAS